MAKYNCEGCAATFSKKSDLMHHRRTSNHKFVCHVCSKSFSRIDNLNYHLKRHVDVNQYNCDECGNVFSRPDSLARHKQSQHRQIGGKRPVDDAEPYPKRFKEDDLKSHYDLKKIRNTFHRKFNTSGTAYKVTFTDIEVREVKEVLKALKKLLSSIIADITKFADDEDLIRISLQDSELDYPIEIPFTKKKDVTVDLLLSEIARVLQSYEQFVLDAVLEIDVIHVKIPKGSGRRRKYVNLERYLQEKKCIIQIKNKDNLCCARAIVTAIAKQEDHPKWNSIKQGWEPQGQLAKELHEKAGIPLEPCGIEEIKQFQTVLPDYRIHVISADHMNGIIYKGPDAERHIYLYSHDNHYDVITSMPAFLNRAYFCQLCHKGYNTKEEHQCNNPCYCCKKVHEDGGDWIYCNVCRRYFKGPKCYGLHLKTSEEGNSTCKTYYRCKDCNITINRRICKGKHQCGNVYCKTCKAYLPPNHMCYMKPVGQKQSEDLCDLLGMDDDTGMECEDDEDKALYIFFDFECTQDDLVQCEKGYEPGERACKNCNKKMCGSFQHVPNLCVAHRVCLKCCIRDVTSTSECNECGKNEHIFANSDEFCKWLFSEENNGATVLCHNFKGYDSYPILHYLFRNAIVPKVIPNGAKNMAVEVPSCDIRMIDSLNFLPSALSKLPKMFGLTELAKGYFPHLFNRKENQQVVLTHLPDIHYYNPNSMKPEDRGAFLEWYENNKSCQFDFQKELLKYCKSDVDILRRCCLAFRQLFMSISGGIDPFKSCITIASACNLVYRTNFLKAEEIAVIPAHRYHPGQKQSVKAIQWLKYLSHHQGLHIQHARNGGEFKVGPYKLDGYYKTERGQQMALEFYGCLWHGCSSCFSRSTINPVNGKTMEELYEKTLDREHYLESQGFTITTIWECQFQKELDSNPDMNAFVRQLNIVPPLEPRDAFFGGRTEAFTLYKEAVYPETIKYFDVTSLYPYINKTGKYPIGHPEIILENFEDLHTYEGLIKCKVIPPRGLLLPVLPCKINNKLLFSLCRTCAETQQQTVCQHTHNERAFIGTWVSDELKKAVEKGYTIDEMYEVWHFARTEQYDTQTKNGGLFTDYINTFQKIKQQASGWPSWCVDNETKQQYKTDYYEKEGVILDEVQKNPGLRSLAKLMLNSFWGKFGQRSNLQQLEYVSDPARYFEMLTSDQQEVTHVNFINDEIVEMRWRHVDAFVETSPLTNLFIAAYTTAQARLKLYSYLEHLNERVLYCDTDSVIFTSKPGQGDPPLGDYFGELTDEVPHGIITHFVTGGPKSYAYKVKTKTGYETVTKMKGITLNYKNSLEINFDSVKEMVTCKESRKITVLDDKIVRDKKNHMLLTTKQSKDCRVVFDKRVLIDEIHTIPYGF